MRKVCDVWSWNLLKERFKLMNGKTSVTEAKLCRLFIMFVLFRRSKCWKIEISQKRQRKQCDSAWSRMGSWHPSWAIKTSAPRQEKGYWKKENWKVFDVSFCMLHIENSLLMTFMLCANHISGRYRANLVHQQASVVRWTGYEDGDIRLLLTSTR